MHAPGELVRPRIRDRTGQPPGDPLQAVPRTSLQAPALSAPAHVGPALRVQAQQLRGAAATNEANASEEDDSDFGLAFVMAAVECRRPWRGLERPRWPPGRQGPASTAGFDDIIDFELWMYQFHFSCVFCKLFKCNVTAFTLHLKGVGVKGIIVKGIIVIV
jgi:hypothetical protein